MRAYVTTTMLFWLDRIRLGRVVYLADVPAGTRRALLTRALVYRDPETRRAKLTRDGSLICGGAAAARRVHVEEWGRL